MKKTILAILLTSTILTSSASGSYKPNWSYTIPGIATFVTGCLELFGLLVAQPPDGWAVMRSEHKDLTDYLLTKLVWRQFVYSVLFIPTGGYLLYKGLKPNTTSSEKTVTP